MYKHIRSKGEGTDERKSDVDLMRYIMRTMRKEEKEGMIYQVLCKGKRVRKKQMWQIERKE